MYLWVILEETVKNSIGMFKNITFKIITIFPVAHELNVGFHDEIHASWFAAGMVIHNHPVLVTIATSMDDYLSMVQ